MPIYKSKRKALRKTGLGSLPVRRDEGWHTYLLPECADDYRAIVRATLAARRISRITKEPVPVMIPDIIPISIESVTYGKHETVVVTTKKPDGTEEFSHDGVLVGGREVGTVVARLIDEDGNRFVFTMSEWRQYPLNPKTGKRPRGGTEIMGVPGGYKKPGSKSVDELIGEFLEESGICSEALGKPERIPNSFYYADPAVSEVVYDILVLPVEPSQLRRVPRILVGDQETVGKGKFVAYREVIRLVSGHKKKKGDLLARAGNVNNAIFMLLCHDLIKNPEVAAQLVQSWKGPLTYEF